MLVGAMWAGIAGVLKVTRGVSEVISTIMLNAIATGLIAYLLPQGRRAASGSNNIGTKPIPEAGRMPGHPADPRRAERGLRLHRRRRSSPASATGLLNRTRFGFDLRATGGPSPPPWPAASTSSGWSSIAMLHLRRGRRPGRHAAAARRRPLLRLDFPAGLGFTGIAIALLGRNNPVGIAFGALLFAFLDEQSRPAEIRVGIPKEIVTIMQGVIVLSRRHRLRARPPLRRAPPSSGRSAEQLAAQRRAAEPRRCAA